MVLRTVVAGNQANWNVMGHMAQLRKLMGVSDDLHKQYLDQIKADPEVCAINGQPPPPKRQRSTPTPAAGTKAKPAAAGSRPRPPGGRASDGGYVAPPPPPPVQIPTYGLPTRKAPHEDPHGLIGKRVNIIQEDDSTVEGMIVDYNPAEQQHYVLVCIGTADEACEPLPLVEFPDAYQDLGPHPDYVSPIPPTVSQMPPPAARPRNSYGGAAAPGARPGGSKPAAGSAGQKSRPKPTTVRPGGGTAGGGAARLGTAPYNQSALDARLAVADLPELSNMLTAISKRERHIMAELEAAGLKDEALSRSVMEREELVRQITAH